MSTIFLIQLYHMWKNQENIIKQYRKTITEKEFLEYHLY